MKNCFSMKFLGQEIILPKKDVQFHGDFGYAYAYFDLEDYYNGSLIGVVDHDFQEIIPLFPIEQLGKIQLFEHSILLLVNKGIYEECYKMYQVEKKEHGIVWMPLPFLDFEAVNENISKAFIEQDETAGFILYDVTKKNAISNLFHFIDSFAYNKDFNQVVAEAGYYVPYNENAFNKIKTYISLDGKVVAPYLDCDQNRIYDSNCDFQEMILDVMKNMGGYGRL